MTKYSSPSVPRTTIRMCISFAAVLLLLPAIGAANSASDTAPGAGPAVKLDTQSRPERTGPPVRAPRPEGSAKAVGRETTGAAVDDLEFMRNIVYAETSTDDGDPIELTFDAAFLKDAPEATMPVVLYLHGGGYRSGDKSEAAPYLAALARGGYFAMSIDYRVAQQGTYPAAVHDAKAAIRYLRSNARKLNIDPQKIGVFGHSAGGHLAALLGTSGNDRELDGRVGRASRRTSTSVQAVAVLAGIGDMEAMMGEAEQGPLSHWFDGPNSEVREAIRQASPITHVDRQDPPFFIVHGTDDTVVPPEQAQWLHDALRRNRVRSELTYIEGTGHLIRPQEFQQRLFAFFDRHLGGDASSVESTRSARAPGPRQARQRSGARGRRANAPTSRGAR